MSLENSQTEPSLLDKLGIKECFLPDEQAPPVDVERLEQYVRRELPEENASEVDTLIASYRNWHEAFGAALEQNDL